MVEQINVMIKKKELFHNFINVSNVGTSITFFLFNMHPYHLFHISGRIAFT
jgi:hypothetical protein